MSNVLIGIIGVILFIGLALAGALFLGPRFQEATNSSKAAAVIQAAHQVSNAANMYRLNQGETLYSNHLGSLVSGGYLKSLPSIPNASISTIDADGCSGCANMQATGVAFFYGDTPEGRRICEAVSRQNGETAAGEVFSPKSKTMNVANYPKGQGCSLVGGGYYVFLLF